MKTSADGERLAEPLLGRERQERDVRQAQVAAARASSRALFTPSPDEHDLNIRNVPEQRRRVDDRLETLRQSDVARVHHDELVGEPVRFGKRVALGAGRDRGRVRPIRNDRRALGRRALVLDQPLPHRLAERDVAAARLTRKRFTRCSALLIVSL